MASLRNIMNLDEDHFDSRSIRTDKEPGPRSSQEHDRSTSTPSYANQPGLPTTSSSVQTQGRSASTHASHHFATAETSPTSQPLGHHGSNADSADRRQSNTSTDSMDSRYGQGHGQSLTGSYAGAPLRPFMPASSSGDSSVKLTPITGRVSRAKKGVPVHTCEICRPAKTFTRAEHLRRHQLSHQPPDLACMVPGCGRVFHRKDLLERHQQRHDQDDNMTRGGSHTPGQSYGHGSPSVGYASSPPGPMMQMPSGFGGPGSSAGSSTGTSSHDVTMGAGGWPPMHRTTSSRGNPISPAHMRNTPEDFPTAVVKNEYIADALDPNLQSPMPRTVPGYAEPRTTPGLEMMGGVPELCMSDARSSGVAWHDSSGIPSSASGSAYSTPSDHSRSHHASVSTSSAEWNGHMSSYSAATRELQSPIMAAGGYSLGFGYPASPPQMYPSVYGEGMGIPVPGYEDNSMYSSHHTPNTTVRSLSPQLVMCQQSETLVTAPSAIPSGRMMGARACGRQPGQASFGMLTSQDAMPVALGNDVRSAIPAYLEVFWDKVHPMYPIIHKATFEDASDMPLEQRDILECAMAAIATQFLQHKEHRTNGNHLHAYSSHKSKMFTQSEAWPLPIMQAVLLNEYFARFRGRDKESYRPSPRFETLYQMVVNTQIAFVVVSIGQTSLQQWKIWVDMESRRRLLAACFLLDVHSTRYHEQTGSSVMGLDYTSPHTLPIPLSASTVQLWNAQSCQAWITLDYKKAKLMTVANTMPEVLTPADMASDCYFDTSLLLIAHSLQLPRRRSPTTVELIDNVAKIHTDDFAISRLFGGWPGAHTYLALHYTPLHILLSVSGDSWVFNKKVLRVSSFIEHQKQLEKWRNSGSAAVATAFAARALKTFLAFLPPMIEDGNTALIGQGGLPIWNDISDFWAVYMCTLICWAYGHVGKRRTNAPKLSRSEAMRWLHATAGKQPAELECWSERENAQGVVGLVREVLERDCLGGRSILFNDAVGVLRRLDEVDNWKWF